MSRTAQARAKAKYQQQRLPHCIPLQYRTASGVYVDVYPRAPWDARLHQVCRHPGGPDGDTLGTVDDFGDLVETHQRRRASPMGMFFERVPA